MNASNASHADRINSTSFGSRKRPSPSHQSPASSTSSGISGLSTRRRLTSPSSPLSRLASEYQSNSSSSPSSQCNSSASSIALQVDEKSGHVTQTSRDGSAKQYQACSKKDRQRKAAAESQMNCLYALEYREDAIAYMYEMESTTMASVELIDMQPELQWYMRPYLVDFLIEIHQQYRLRPETLCLAINIVDRYVSKRIVYKKHYQLVGCAALWIASKFEDAKDRVPSVEDLCAVCCSAYDQSAFIQMEGHVLSTIGWCLGHPTAEAWLRIACAEGPTMPMEDQRTQHVARFLMEITLFHRAFVSIKPSDIALACLMLARCMCAAKQPRRPNERSEVVKIAQMLDVHLAEHLEQVSSTVVKKYSPSFYSRASLYVREWYLAGRRFTQATFSTSSTISAHPSSEVPEVDMSTSSPSSANSSQNGESDYDEDEFDSEPITPTTSISSCSSDPFEQLQVRLPQGSQFYGSQDQTINLKDVQQSIQQHQQHPQRMQWQMHVVAPPSQSQQLPTHPYQQM